MSSTSTYDGEVANYRGGTETLTLHIVENDGRIGIGLSAGVDNRMCLIDVGEAEKVIMAISEALARARKKAPS